MTVVSYERKHMGTRIAEMLDALRASGRINDWRTAHADDGRLLYVIDNVPCSPTEAFDYCVEAVAR